MRFQINKNFIGIAITESPQFDLINEENISDRILFPSPIFHSWLRNDDVGIIGVKFSSWMINMGCLSKDEKELVKAWNKSDSDFEIFFGSVRDYKSENSLDEITQNTSIIRFEKIKHGIAFPLFGAKIDKKEMARLESNLLNWVSK